MQVIGLFFPEITPNFMQPNMRRKIEYMCGLANKIYFNSICNLKKEKKRIVIILTCLYSKDYSLKLTPANSPNDRQTN